MPHIRGSSFVQAALIALALTFASGEPARAGTMYVYSCHTPSGAPAGTAGWTHTRAPSRADANNDCPTGPNGVLFAQSIGVDWNAGERPIAGHVGWVFKPAPGTSVEGFTASVCPEVSNGGYAVVLWTQMSDAWFADFRRYPDGSSLGSTFYCHGAAPYWADPRNVVTRQGLQASHVSFIASCFFCNWTASRGASR